MARIHIDSDFLIDYRIRQLEGMAKGTPTMKDYVRSRLIEIFHYCYSHMVSVLPSKTVDALAGEIGFSGLLIACDLAADEGQQQIRIKGVESRTAALAAKMQKCKAAGQVSAKKRASLYGSAQPKPERRPNGRSTDVQQTFGMDCSKSSSEPCSSLQAPLPNGRSTDVQRLFDPARTDVRGSSNVTSTFPNAGSGSGSGSVISLDREIKQKKKDPTISASAPAAAATTAGGRVWEAYRASMMANWPGSIEPPRSAKTNSQCKQLVDQVGEELAVKLAAYYPTRRGYRYVQAGHPLGLLLLEFNALIREMNAGVKLTPTVVKEIVQREESENFQRFEASKPVSAIDILTMSNEEYEAYQNSPERLAALDDEQKAHEAALAQKRAAHRELAQTGRHGPENRQIGPCKKEGA